MRSLYEYIKSHLENDVLPDDFSLPREVVQGQLCFADGALDGMTMYHMMGADLDEAEKVKMWKMIKLISDGEVAQADAALEEFSKKHRALSVIDDFENMIRENRHELSAANIYRYAIRLVTESSDKECVKYGLEMLELFTLKDENVKDMIRILGLSDEFTLFAVFMMYQWENANEEIFRLARKVKGWGRIHAIEKLEPETEEIREWLLKEGIDNCILPDYSALTCFEKAEVTKRLEGDLSGEEFQSIGRILKAMIVEGPVPGISGVENRQEVLARYLEHAKKHDLVAGDYDTISKIYDYSKDVEKQDEYVIKLCQDILE